MTVRQEAVSRRVGQLYDIIQAHMDEQGYEISVRQVAKKIGVSPTTVANWKTPTKLIKKKHLEAIARVTGRPYAEVLNALLSDIGYEPGETADSQAG